MTTLEMLRGWGGPQDTFEIVQVNAESPEEWTAQLRTTATTAATGLNLFMRKSKGEERVWIAFEEDVPGDVLRLTYGTHASGEILPRLITAINDTRAGSVTCSMRNSDTTATIEIQAVIYEEGFSRHILNFAVFEMAKAYHTIQRQYAELTGVFQLIAQQQKEVKTEMQSSLEPATSNPCQACRATNPPGSRFCNQCGTSLAVH